MEKSRPPVPPFTLETAMQKVRMAEDAWNTCDPEKVSLAYTIDSAWRNRSVFINGREEIVEFLQKKWARELDYRLIKELWAFNLKTSVGSRKSTQALGAPGKTEKFLITNKVTTNSSVSPCTPISYVSFSRSTEVSRFRITGLLSVLLMNGMTSLGNGFVRMGMRTGNLMRVD